MAAQKYQNSFREIFLFVTVICRSFLEREENEGERRQVCGNATAFMKSHKQSETALNMLSGKFIFYCGGTMTQSPPQTPADRPPSRFLGTRITNVPHTHTITIRKYPLFDTAFFSELKR